MIKTFRHTGKLIGLEWRDVEDGFYVYGDPEEQLIESRARGPPDTIQGIPIDTPYSRQLPLIERQAPRDVNAFVLGNPVQSVMGEEKYDIPIQWYLISGDAWSKSIQLELPEKRFGGFF